MIYVLIFIMFFAVGGFTYLMLKKTKNEYFCILFGDVPDRESEIAKRFMIALWPWLYFGYCCWLVGKLLDRICGGG